MDGADNSRRLLRRFIAQEPIDLARAALAVAREEYPDLDEGRYLGMLDRLAEGIQAGLPARAIPGRPGGRMNADLFHQLRVCGNQTGYYDPRQSLLNRMLH